jgi:hypothetical protein
MQVNLFRPNYSEPVVRQEVSGHHPRQSTARVPLNAEYCSSGKFPGTTLITARQDLSGHTVY